MKSFDLSIYRNVLDLPHRIVDPFSWIPHIPFSFFLIDIFKPELFVELGVHTGNSYNAFCQAVQTLKTDTKCFGIDTWQGDEHAGFYDEKVYNELSEYQRKYYKDFSVLIKSTFDMALEKFTDGSIDLLHIDGLHTYEGVKHDFENWLPKMSQRGVVLFHDTSVREDDFGVWKLWEEIQKRYPSVELKHGNGLGVAIVGKDTDLGLDDFISSYKENSFYSTFFSRIGEYLKTFSELEIKTGENESLKTQVNQLRKELERRGEIILERDESITKYHNMVVEKDREFKEYNSKITENVKRLNDKLVEKENTIREVNNDLQKAQGSIRAHEQNLKIKTSELEKTTNRLSLMADEIDRRGNTLEKLRAQNRRISKELSLIKASRSWRAVEKYRAIRTKISRITRKPRICFETFIYALRVLKNDGIRFFWSKVRDRMRLRRLNISNHPGLLIPNEKLLEFSGDALASKECPDLDCKVSVFIPTKNAGSEFNELLSRLKRQKGLPEIEIIIVDSGSEDNTVDMAERFGSKVISIDPASFNHGETRNIGIEQSSGDYILYITQDVMPIGDDFVYHLASVLEDNRDVAAVTCKQIPRSDVDMFFLWSMENHYTTLNLLHDKIMWSDNPQKLSPIQKRSFSSLDNVCTLYRKSILEKYRFKRLPFAEDLDLGVRLVEDRHRIAFLASSAVIHSHNRPPFYSLKRSYMDARCQNDIIENGRIVIHSDINDALDDIVLMFEKINYMLSKRDGSVPLKSITDYFRKNGRLETPLTKDLEFSNFMLQLMAYRSESLKENKKIFFDNFSKRLDAFFSSITEKSIVIDETNIDDFNESVYKLYASVIGSQLSAHCTKSNESSQLSKEINSVLAKDV